MKIKALQAFTLEDLTSVACGAVVEVTDTLGASLIEDGLAEEYTLITPTGTKSITENGENIDVAEYAKANVNVAQPTGKIEITANGTDIDVSQYATADVSVPNPSTGTLPITANNTYDVTQYASVDVNVPSSSTEIRSCSLIIGEGIDEYRVASLVNNDEEFSFIQVGYEQDGTIRVPVINGNCKVVLEDPMIHLALDQADSHGCTLSDSYVPAVGGFILTINENNAVAKIVEGQL